MKCFDQPNLGTRNQHGRYQQLVLKCHFQFEDYSFADYIYNMLGVIFCVFSFLSSRTAVVVIYMGKTTLVSSHTILRFILRTVS